MNDAENPRAVIGSNNPPDPAAERAADIIAAANRWATERPELTDQDMADKCSAFLDQINAATKAVEEARKTEKKPHMDAAKAVDDKWKPWAEKLDVAKRLLTPKLTAWLNKLRAQQEAEARAKQEEARKLAEEAARAAAKAEKAAAKAGGDVIGATVQAEEAARAAAEAEKAAAKIAAAPVNIKSGLGARTKSLRTNWRADVTDLPKAVWHYRHHPKMAALVQELANADARAMAREQGGKSTIPGVAFVAEQVAA